jgi:hypothetical protein
MTVRELIELLQGENPDAEVFVSDDMTGRQATLEIKGFKWFGENPVRGVDIIHTGEDYDLT